MKNLTFSVSCGATLCILPVFDVYQLVQIENDQVVQSIGGLHSTIVDAVDAAVDFDLIQKERNTLDEIRNSVISTHNAILDLLKQHSEYLANL